MPLLFLGLTIVATLALLTSQAHAQITCPDSFTDVLTLIYDEMGGPNWAANNWFSAADPCTWTGIECNQNDDVIYMDLSDMGLTGPISDAFECLPFLKSLYLNDNALSGPIPESLCTLTHLSYLQVRNAELSGDVPECLCDLTNVMFLYLSNNALTGTIPACLAALPFLRELHLDCNDVEGAVPPAFASQPSLEELWVNCNVDLACPGGFPEDRLLRCGDVGCDDCGLVPGQCPPSVEVEGCGTYYPEEDVEINTSTSGHKPTLC